MHDAMLVRCGERLRDGDADLVDLGKRDWALANPFAEGLALQKLHDQKFGPVVGTDVIELTDAGMAETRDGTGLALHALLEFGRGRQMGGENFDGDGAIESGIESAVDLTH